MNFSFIVAETIDERFDKLESSMNTRLDEIKEMIVRGMTGGWNFAEIDSDYPNKRMPAANKDSADGGENKFESGGTGGPSAPRGDEVKRYNNSIHVISTAHG